MIAIIDYDAGNTCSVISALKRIDADYVLTSETGILQKAEKVILPGVGHAGQAMESLRRNGLDKKIKSLDQPLLGICVGQQLMCTHSEESDTECLGIFDAQVKRFRPTEADAFRKVPHMGWNTINYNDSPLFKDIPEESYLYFVHSYYCEVTDDTTAICNYNMPFSAAMQKDNYYGVQFHPEKSGTLGQQIIKNFLEL